MALTLVGTASGSGTGASYNVSLAGLGVQPNDIVVVSVGHGDTAATAPTVTGNNNGAYTAEGGTLRANDTWDANYGLFTRKMGATVDTSLTITRPNNAAYGGGACVQVWRGADTTNHIDATGVLVATTNGSRGNPPAITPTTEGAVIIAGGAGCQGTAGSAFTVPAGMTNAVTINSDGTTSDTGVWIASAAWTSGAYDPPAWTGGATSTSSSAVGQTIALKPAIASSTGTATNTFAPLTGAADATNQAGGSGSNTFAAMTGAGSSQNAIQSNTAATLVAVTAIAAALLTLIANASATLRPMTGAGSSQANVGGSGSNTLRPMTATGDATLVTLSVGTANNTFAAMTGAGASVLPINATAAGSFAPLTGAGSSLADIAGTAAGSFAPLTGAGSSQAAIVAAGGASFDPLTTITAANLRLTGQSGTLTFDPMTGAGSSVADIAGNTSASFNPITATGTAVFGTFSVGSSSFVFDALTGAGSSQANVTGTGDASFADLTVMSQAGLPITATGVVWFDPMGAEGVSLLNAPGLVITAKNLIHGVKRDRVISTQRLICRVLAGVDRKRIAMVNKWSWIKHPNETLNVGRDWTRDLGDGDTLSGDPTILIKGDNTLVCQFVETVGNIVKMKLTGGKLGNTAPVTVELTQHTSNGETLIDTIRVFIRV